MNSKTVTTTVTKEYDVEGRLVKETTITSEYEQAETPPAPIPTTWPLSPNWPPLGRTVPGEWTITNSTEAALLDAADGMYQWANDSLASQ